MFTKYSRYFAVILLFQAITAIKTKSHIEPFSTKIEEENNPKQPEKFNQAMANFEKILILSGDIVADEIVKMIIKKQHDSNPIAPIKNKFDLNQPLKKTE